MGAWPDSSKACTSLPDIPPILNVYMNTTKDHQMTPIAQLVSSHAAEVAECEHRAAAAQGTAVYLDPARVAESPFTAFAVDYYSREFLRLKSSIEHTGGNVSPIKVRPVHDGRFEIVLGYARHRACLELGLPVAAVVEDMSDLQLVQQFVAHQSFKKWSPWRVGSAIGRGIDGGLFPSLRRAAESLGMTVSDCFLLLKLDRLPQPVKSRLSKVALTPASARRLVKQWEINPSGAGEVPKALRVLYAPPAA